MPILTDYAFNNESEGGRRTNKSRSKHTSKTLRPSVKLLGVVHTTGYTIESEARFQNTANMSIN